MKKWIFVIMCLWLVSCLKNTNTSIEEDYEQKKGKIILQSNEEIPYSLYTICLTKNDDIPIAVFNVLEPFKNDYYLDLNKMCKDMKGVGDSLKIYLDENKKSGVIFVVFTGPYDSAFVMNYMEKVLYIPKYYDDIKNLVEKFNTVNITDIKSNSEGLNYLINNEFVVKSTDGYSDNGLKQLARSYWVYIMDGKYGEYGKDTGIKLSFDSDGNLAAK